MTDKLREIYLDKIIRVTWHKNAQDNFYYSGECIDICDGILTLIDRKTKNPISLPFKECRVEVI